MCLVARTSVSAEGPPPSDPNHVTQMDDALRCAGVDDTLARPERAKSSRSNE